MVDVRTAGNVVHQRLRDRRHGRAEGVTTARRWLVAALLGLSAGVATAAVLGPLWAEVIRYRTSPTTLNQVAGGDLAALALVAPVALLAAVLVARGHRAGPVVALAPGGWAMYVHAQLIVGQEHLDLPGNGERFFPLLLGVFLLGAVVVTLAWREVADMVLPPMGRRLRRGTGVLLVAVAAFLVAGLHVPSLLDALGPQPSALEYTTSPTAFWMVKLMDLGLVVPAALAVGVGLLRGSAAAQRASYAILGGYSLLGASVACMAVVMWATGDPDGSLVNMAVFVLFAAVFLTAAVLLHRPLFGRSGGGQDGSVDPVGGLGLHLGGDVIGDRTRPAEDDDLPRVEPGDLVQDDLGDLPLGGDVEDRPAAQL